MHSVQRTLCARVAKSKNRFNMTVVNIHKNVKKNRRRCAPNEHFVIYWAVAEPADDFLCSLLYFLLGQSHLPAPSVHRSIHRPELCNTKSNAKSSSQCTARSKPDPKLDMLLYQTKSKRTNFTYVNTDEKKPEEIFIAYQ